MASPQSIHGVEASTGGEARDTSVCSPASERSAATLQCSGSAPLSTTTAGRTFLDSDWNILVKECSSLAAKWRTVSTYLGLPKEMVDQIEADHSKSVERCWSEALSKFVQQNAPADVYGLPSWSTLLKAIVIVDPCLARKLAAKYQCSLAELTPETPQATDENKPSPDQVTKPPPAAAAEGTPTEKSQSRSETGVEMVRSNVEEINALFTALLLTVQAALEVSSDATRVRDFLITFFKQDFPPATKVKDLLQRVTVNNLWSYDHYSPLEKLIKHFLAGNEEIATMMSEYKERLTGHYMTTKLIEYMQYRKELFTSESDTESDEEPTDPSPPKLTKKLHKRIKVVLKLERKISTLSLQYVHNLWIAFAKEYDIPSLTAILEKIATGSLEISWLIPASFAERIRPRSRFFRKHGIVKVFIDGDIIYDENQMAVKERKFLALCYEGTAPVNQFSSLLDEGVDPDLYDKEGNHPLWHASYEGRLDLVELFLRYRASVDLATQDDIGETALVAAFYKGYYQVVEVLVRHGADVNYRTKSGQSVLWIAAFNGYTDITRHLLEHGAEVDLPNTNEYGDTALVKAVDKGHHQIVEVLVRHGADVNYRTKKGQSVLWKAARKGHTDIARCLLDHGAEVDLPNTDTKGETPLFAACAGGHKATAALLVERGAAINYQRKDGSTPLYHASQGGHVELVSLLLEKGADLNKGQQPPLYTASLRGHVDVVKVLVDHGAVVNKRCDDEVGATPLITACHDNQLEVVRLLIEHGADVNLQNREGRTALMVASWRGHLKAVLELLRAGALTDSQDQEGLTALILATQNKHSDVVDALLEFKADLNITENTAGWSALFFAVKSGNLEIVKRLIREGANVEMRDKNGLTAAEISDDEVICEELKQHSLCTVEPVSEVQTSQEEQDDTSTDVSQSDHEDSQSKKLMAEDQQKETGKDSEGDSGEGEQESKGHVKQQNTQEKKRDLVKKSYQKLLRIFDVLEDSLLPGRKEKREYQKKKETPSNIAEANKQMYEDQLNT